MFGIAGDDASLEKQNAEPKAPRCEILTDEAQSYSAAAAAGAATERSCFFSTMRADFPRRLRR